ncbi:MAG: hypothetical protein PUD02_04460 [Eggerthellales bacterium]|nr:hypothetical protein [Eggerthellales bacterium]
MTITGTKADAERFVKTWTGRGDEKQDTQLFWIDLLQNVLGVDDAISRLRFEVSVDTAVSDHKGFIDVLLSSSGIIVEQKSLGVDLSKPELRQGRMVTPAQQALAYVHGMPRSSQPRYVIACNFSEFWVYDLNLDPLCKQIPLKINLDNLPQCLPDIQFIKGEGEAPQMASRSVSIEAGKIMSRLHDIVAARFIDPDAPESHHALSVFMTRLVFLMFCEDVGIIEPNAFRDYVQHFQAADLRRALKDLFVWLDTPDNDRDPYAEEWLKKLPYMNGGLFREQTEIPPLDETFRTTLIVEGCQQFDWSEVSPTVFGSIFEGALSHDHRRANGQHFTSPESIHKLIDPLFLDDLNDEFEEACSRPVAGGARRKALVAFHEKLGRISILDPASGAGNFLTESYICLRRLEDRVLFELQKDGQQSISFEELGDEDVLVNLRNFHGIEIEDFACCVARTALWIAEKQADINTAKVTRRIYEPLPLTDYQGIVRGNALSMDWNKVVPADEVGYIVGNPPFLGGMTMSPEQKQDMKNVFGATRGVGELDYVSAWYVKAAEYIGGRNVLCAFVSTNSICQGLSVGIFWKKMKEELGADIAFAYRTFVWDSQADDQAHVHVVIVCFGPSGALRGRTRRIFSMGDDGLFHSTEAANINGYLFDADDVYVTEVSSPICDVPPMRFGSMPRSKGFTLTAEQREEFVKANPLCEKWIRPYWGADEFLKRKERYCLWMVDADPAELMKCPKVMERISQVKSERMSSKAEATRRFAATPTLFAQIAQPEGEGSYLLVPCVSSSRRPYIPIGFVSNEVIASNLAYLVPNADLFHFGVMSSQFHNAWMRMVAGRLKSDYRYAKDLVYNTFIWPDCDQVQREAIERAAAEVLSCRDRYPNVPIGKMYTEMDLLFPDLVKAHKALDAAVEAAYGVDFGGDEEKIVAHLFRLYAELTS